MVPNLEQKVSRVDRNKGGRPGLYQEKKERINLGLTPTGVKGLDLIADAMGLSRSEFVERIGRGLIPLGLEWSDSQLAQVEKQNE